MGCSYLGCNGNREPETDLSKTPDISILSAPKVDNDRRFMTNDSEQDDDN